MAWVDVAKTYDSVDHAMFTIHRFPKWFGSTVMKKLTASWNTRIVVETKQGLETSEIIRFKKGLPQGDALCPALFTLCLNPTAWKLRATEGYKLSRPISQKVTHLLYIDDLKAFAASDSKLERVLRVVKEGMECIVLKWNEKKCASDQHKVVDSNQYALPLLTYLMWTQVWPLADLQQLDREARKIVLENGGNHPQGSSAMMYLSRKCGGRGMKSVEREYKNTKIKTAVKLFSNPDPAMAAVRSFEAKAV